MEILFYFTIIRFMKFEVKILSSFILILTHSLWCELGKLLISIISKCFFDKIKMKFSSDFISISTITHWCEPRMLLEFLIIFGKNIHQTLERFTSWNTCKNSCDSGKPLRVWGKNVNRFKPLKDFHVCLWKLLSFLNLLDHSWLGIMKGGPL